MGVTLLSRGELNKSDLETTPIRDLRDFCKLVVFINLCRERGKSRAAVFNCWLTGNNKLPTKPCTLIPAPLAVLRPWLK